MDHFEDFLNELSSGKRNKTLDFHFKKGTDIQLFSNIPFGIPSRIPQLDLAIGRIGLPAGRIIEIFGFEMSGKSCMALAAVASVQRLGGCAVWIDTAQPPKRCTEATAANAIQDLPLISNPNISMIRPAGNPIRPIAKSN